MPPDPTYLGSVQDVRGATVSVALDEDTLSGLAFIGGAGYRIGQVGSFVRIPMGFTDLFGVVSQVGAGSVPERLAEVEPFGRRWMTVQLIGEGMRGQSFERGLAQYPTVGDAVHLVSQEDLASLYGGDAMPGHVTVGQLASAEAIPARIDANRLVNRHAAVVGATGAGKSTLVISLVDALSAPETYPGARVLLLDTHGEYAAALADRARVFRIGVESEGNVRPLAVPYWAMTFDELLALTFGDVDDVSRAGILDKIVAMKRDALTVAPRDGAAVESLTADTPVPFSIHRMWLELHESVNATHTAAGTGQSEETRAYLLNDAGRPVEKGDALRVVAPRYQAQVASKIYLSASSLNIRRQLDSLASKLRDPRYDFLFRPSTWTPAVDGAVETDLDDLLKTWLDSKVAILDLSGIPSSILTELVGAVLRIVYDALFWGRYLAQGGRRRPLLVILEEAHAYLSERSAESAKSAVRRIVKEGRKYGVGAMVVSQRPAEVDPTILSQCGTTFAMRLSNANDRGHVTAAVTDHLEGLLNMLPVLRTGEAIVVGEAVRLPLRMLTIPSEGRMPESYDPVVYDPEQDRGWTLEPVAAEAEAEYKAVARAWRALDASRAEH